MMMSMSTRVMALAPSTTSTRTTTTTTPRCAVDVVPSRSFAVRSKNVALRRGRSVVTAGLKDLDKDLAKVNPSQMSDALQGDDRDARREAVIGVGGCVAAGVMTWWGLAVQVES
jgi:hypothetical protein